MSAALSSRRRAAAATRSPSAAEHTRMTCLAASASRTCRRAPPPGHDPLGRQGSRGGALAERGCARVLSVWPRCASPAPLAGPGAHVRARRDARGGHTRGARAEVDPNPNPTSWGALPRGRAPAPAAPPPPPCSPRPLPQPRRPPRRPRPPGSPAGAAAGSQSAPARRLAPAVTHAGRCLQLPQRFRARQVRPKRQQAPAQPTQPALQPRGSLAANQRA